MAEDFSPVYVGDVGAIFAPQFLHKDNSPVNITGCTITMKMELYSDLASGVAIGTTKTCSGSWTVDDAVNGKAHYRFQSADADTSGVWNLWIKITDGSGNPVHADDGNGNAKRITILPAK